MPACFFWFDRAFSASHSNCTLLYTTYNTLAEDRAAGPELLFDGKSQKAPLFGCQRLPNAVRNRVHLAAVVDVPAAYETNRYERARCACHVWRASMQRPGMANEYVADLQRYRLHLNFPRFHRAFRSLSRHPVSARRNLDWAMCGRYAHQAEADGEHVGRQREVRGFSKQGALKINVCFLILRFPHRYVTTPLVGHHPLVHDTADNAQHAGIEEEFRREARRLKGHRQKMAMRSTVGLFAMALQIIEKNRPEGLTAGVNRRLRQMRLQDAKAFSL